LNYPPLPAQLDESLDTQENLGVMDLRSSTSPFEEVDRYLRKDKAFSANEFEALDEEGVPPGSEIGCRPLCLTGCASVYGR
jgi:hypothetical protein